MPLLQAAARGNLELSNKLIEAGADEKEGWRERRARALFEASPSVGIISS